MLPTQEILEKIAFLHRHTNNEAAANWPHRERYVLNPVLHWQEVQAYEATNRLRLPEEIREFVTAVGNGGVGPFSGLGKLGYWGQYIPASSPFDLSHFVRVKKYSEKEYHLYRKREARSIILSKGRYNPFIHPNGYQREMKKRWGVDLADDEYIEYGSLEGCLPIGRYRGAIVQLLIDATPQYAGSILLAPSTDYEQKSKADYQFEGAFGAFYLRWLDRQVMEVAHWGHYNQFKQPLLPRPPEGTPAYATRVVFPGPAAALAASPFFINEKGVGCWRCTDDPEILVKGQVLRSERYALHLPSIDREGNSLASYILAGFMLEAQRIGLDQRNRATGYWTLSDTGALQQETIWILYAEKEIPEDPLRQLAQRVLQAGNQDAVAIEVRGKVEVLRR